MKEKLPRRSFLTRLGIGLSTLAAMPVSSLSKSFKSPEKMNPVKNIKMLGFQWETADPFLFCVHHEDAFPKGNEAMGPAESLAGRHLGDDFIIKNGYRMYHGKVVPGFPGHPHRGFETITVVRQGIVDHADSMGAAGRYGNGDVQWMTAGKGVQHSEMFPLIAEDRENPMELFQIWLNLPAKNKMVEPHFKMFWAENIPVFEHTDLAGKSTRVEVIAGKLGDKTAPAPPPDSWASKPDNHVAVWNIKMDAGATWILPKTAPGVNRTLYFYQGSMLQLEDDTLKNYHAAEIVADVDIQITNGDAEAGILILQGRPIGETVIQYGPFVMNSKDEIMQAFSDYQKTQFGGWPWPRFDQVHPREKGRFARHADGREEVKG